MTRINTFSLDSIRSIKRDHDRLKREVIGTKQNLAYSQDSAGPVDRLLDWVWIKNTTGVDLDQYQVVDLQEPVYRPTTAGIQKFKREKSFRTDLPAPGPAVIDSSDQAFKTLRTHAVTLRRIHNNTFGPAATSGKVHCLIDMKQKWHRRATVASGNQSFLESHPSGFAEILWVSPPRSGVNWAYVDLGRRVEMIFKGKSNQCIDPGSFGSVSLYDGHTDTGEDVQAHLDWMHCNVRIDPQKELLVQWNHMDQEWWIPNAECNDCPDPLSC